MFAGLGSAAPVLTETVEMIAAAVPDKALFQVDVGDHSGNGFAQQIHITADPLSRRRLVTGSPSRNAAAQPSRMPEGRYIYTAPRPWRHHALVAL